MGFVLTPKEQEICNHYIQEDESGKVHCYECPLNVTELSGGKPTCYRTLNRSKKIYRDLPRYE